MSLTLALPDGLHCRGAQYWDCQLSGDGATNKSLSQRCGQPHLHSELTHHLMKALIVCGYAVHKPEVVNTLQVKQTPTDEEMFCMGCTAVD